MGRSIITKRYMAVVAAVGALSALGPGTAAAADGASYEFKIKAHVPLFCRISAPFDGLPLSADATLSNGITLGSVTEVCNSTTGYRVEARFMNLDSGTLMLDDQPRAVQAGLVSYSHPRASRQARLWRLADAVAASTDQPIYVRLSISPL